MRGRGPRAAPGSPPRCRRSPTPSVTRHVGASTCSSATTPPPAETRRGDRVGRRRRGRGAPERRPPPSRQAGCRRLRRGRSPRAARGRRRPQAGRPSKHYVAVRDRRGRTSCPVRSDDLVLALLGQALARLPHDQAEAMAEDVGATLRSQPSATGLPAMRCAAGQRSLRSAMQAVADALTAHGFAAHTTAGRRRAGPSPPHHQRPLPVRQSGHRPPGDLRRRPGLVRGMLGVLYPSAPSSTSPPRLQRPRRHDLRDRGLRGPSPAFSERRQELTPLPIGGGLPIASGRGRTYRCDPGPSRTSTPIRRRRASDRRRGRGRVQRRGRRAVAHRQARPADRRPAAKIAYVELGAVDGDRRIGFGG